MLKEMERIGLPDTQSSRAYITEHLTVTLNNPSNISGISKGISIRESLLMGPRGGVKLDSYWDGDALKTFVVQGGIR